MNDAQRRVIDLADLLNVEMVKGDLKKFDEAWEESPLTLEKEPEEYVQVKAFF